MYTAESGHTVLVGMALNLPSQLDEVFPDPCPLQILPVPQGLESTFNKERVRLPGGRPHPLPYNLGERNLSYLG